MPELATTLKTSSVSIPVDATIGSVLHGHAAIRPRQAAIVAPGFPPFSYGELVRHIDLIGAALRNAGLGRTSRVALLLPSCPELGLTSIAVAANAIAIPCNPNLPPAHIQQLLARLEVHAVVLPDWLEPPQWLATSPGRLTLLRVARAGDSLAEALISGSESGETQPDGHAEDVALILQTSGTIGPPKLVPVTHRNLMAMARRMEHCFELSHLDRCACLLPLYYAQGIKSACIVPLLAGGSIAIPEPPIIESLENWLSQLQPTWFPAGPTFLQAVLDRLRNSPLTLDHNLRFVISGSASLPEPIRVGVENALGAPVLDAWGMTEIGLLTGNSIRIGERKPGTVGYAFPGEVAILGSEGKFCGAAEAGEVVVRGPSVLSSYLADDELNRAAFTDGWFHTGDLGSIDADGFLRITGRIKEIINRGGEKISPVIVEQALIAHPAVQQAAAFGIPHARLGEAVAAAIVPRPGNKLTAAELQNFLAGSLPAQAIPRSIFFLTALPKGPTGKILRKELAIACRPGEGRIVVPPADQLETQLAELWQKLLQRDDIGVEDDFFEAGGDSLLASQMMVEAEGITHKLLRGRALPVPTTIRALAHDVAGAAPLRNEALVVQIKPGRGGTPFFYCHGDYLFHGRYAWKLADLIGEDCPFYLLNNYEIADLRGAPSMEELAKGYLPALLAAHPTGAFRLGGHCNGGLMALELARQLSALGRVVETIVLIEPISLNARPCFRFIGHLLDTVFAAVPYKKTRRTLRAAIMFLLWRTFRWACERLRINSPAADDPSLETQETKKVYQRLMANYTPPRLSSRVVCLTAEASSRAVEFDWKPWLSLSPAVTAHVIPGTHMSCLTTHVVPMAETLRQTLASAAYAASGNEK